MNVRTKSLIILPEVKREVKARDGGRCVYCYNPGLSNAHFIARSQGGLGVERNILTLCPACHARFDQSEHRSEMREYFARYLKSCYSDWSEDALAYRKRD
ncbi:MAG: HNH endonuclease [Oscillospiraceae bacterium]|jgi:5-methylcytosine-specific restriction endonuclease McrA|nr:HNH endonuclease [Oscillospiraceae bacterium]